MISTLVIKAVRACNLRCPYCYYINEDTQAYGITLSDTLIHRLYQTYGDYASGREDAVNLIWHGGEPLILGRRRFQEILDAQAPYFGDAQVRNVVQTNGTLIDAEWVDFFHDNSVGVGISLDGVRDTHDAMRFDSHDRGTFDRIVEAINLLERSGIGVGVLCVAGPEIDGVAFLRLLKELGIHGCDFLIPMTNHAVQRQPGQEVDMEKVGKVLRDAFLHWVGDDNPEIRVPLFESLILNALGLRSVCSNAGATFEQLETVAVIETNGDICMDVEFGEIDRLAGGDEYRLGANLADQDFNFARVEEMLKSRTEAKGLAETPSECWPCPARTMCRGSHPGSRYDDLDGSFQHRSAYCEAMLPLSLEVVDYLDRSGLRPNLIDPRLRTVA
ncbi:MAG: radical SAM protein [Acidobacteria bacterium]|nr:radical SAM protein [Acidobacteriota bacterium]MDA1237193.1 radical SAM protein [Acidobacteriota bacterium]